MTKQNPNLQDSFLNQARKDNLEIEVMLLTGTTFTGVIKGFDNFTVIVESGGKQHLVYKHGIAQLIGLHFSRPSSPRSENRKRPPKPSKGDKPAAGDKKGENKFNALDLSGIEVDEGGQVKSAEETEAGETS